MIIMHVHVVNGSIHTSLEHFLLILFLINRKILDANKLQSTCKLMAYIKKLDQLSVLYTFHYAV